MEMVEKAEAQLVGAGRLINYCDGSYSDVSSKTRRLKRIQEEAKPLVTLRADLKRHLDDEFPVPSATRRRLANLLA